MDEVQIKGALSNTLDSIFYEWKIRNYNGNIRLAKTVLPAPLHATPLNHSEYYKFRD